MRKNSLVSLALSLLLVFGVVSMPMSVAAAADAPSSWAVHGMTYLRNNMVVREPLLSSYTARDTRLRFTQALCDLTKQLMAYKNKPFDKTSAAKTFVDCSDTDVLRMHYYGVAGGLGNQKFNPGGSLERQMAFVFLYRALKLADPAFVAGGTGKGLTSYADSGKVATWAKTATDALLKLGIVGGTSPTTIAPVKALSNEEALLLIARVHAKYLAKTTINSKQTSLGLAVNGRHAMLGQTQSAVTAAWGTPAETIATNRGFTWQVYHQNYANMALIGIAGGKVVALLGCGYFAVTGTASGSQTLTKYLDGNEGNRFYMSLSVSDPSVYRLTGNLTAAQVALNEREHFLLVNAFRVMHHIPALARNTSVDAVARAHSQDMVTRKYFSHYSPEGKGPSQRLQDAGIAWSACGENIAWSSYAMDGIQFVNQWVQSAGHRGNMLDPVYNTIGVGFIFDASSSYRNMATQVFVRK